MGLQLFDQGTAHGFDAHAHGLEFAFPQAAQCGCGEHHGHHLRALGGWAGVVGTNNDLHLTQHACRFLFAGAHHAERAHAFAVKREALRERGGHEKVHARGQELLHSRAVFGNAFAEALVGHVQKGDQAFGLDRRDHLRPLLGREVVAGRVVATGVQRHDGAVGRGLQCGQHGVKADAASFRVVVGIGIDVETGAGEQRAVVFPAGVADEHGGVGVQLFQEVGTQFQTAGAAHGLHRDHAARGDGLMVSTKHQALHGLVVSRNAVDGQVAVGLGRVCHLALGLGHALQQGQLARVVVVDAHAEVDFGRVGVGVELFGQTQNRVTRGGFDGLEYGGGQGHRHERFRGNEDGCLRATPIFTPPTAGPRSFQPTMRPPRGS